MGGIAFFSGGVTFNSTTDHAGVARFASTSTFTGLVTLTGGATSAAVISCGTAPTQGQHLVNKTYVDGQAIGVGQTWQNVKLSRAVNTAYTNDTGRPIMVSVSCGSSQRLDPILVGAVDIGNIVNTTTTTSAFSFVVPSGITYQCGGAGDSFNIWCELR